MFLYYQLLFFGNNQLSEFLHKIREDSLEGLGMGTNNFDHYVLYCVECINHDGLIIKEKVMGYMSVVNDVVIL